MKFQFDNPHSQFALDLADAKKEVFAEQNLTLEEAEELFRKEIFEAVGLDINKPLKPRAYINKKNDIFEIIEDTITPIINDRLEAQMGEFADVRILKWGDSIEFDVENPDLFEVSIITDGTGNLRRQRLDNGKLKVEVETLGIKVYDEFYRFLAGRTNWSRVIAKVVKSYMVAIAEKVQSVLFQAHPTFDPMFIYTGTYNEDKILEVCAAVEAEYGSAMIMGTKQGLAPLKPSYAGDSVKDQYNQLGHVGRFVGYDTVAMVQSFRAGTREFTLRNDMLLVLPATSERFVKILLEGEALIRDFDNAQGDQSIEHLYTQKVGVGLALAREYGVITLQ